MYIFLLLFSGRPHTCPRNQTEWTLPWQQTQYKNDKYMYGYKEKELIGKLNF